MDQVTGIRMAMGCQTDSNSATHSILTIIGS